MRLIMMAILAAIGLMAAAVAAAQANHWPPDLWERLDRK